MTLPQSISHPDPVDTGSIVASEHICRACGRATGYIDAGL